jgi:DNA-binding NarL/FixJ family response regulator
LLAGEFPYYGSNGGINARMAPIRVLLADDHAIVRTGIRKVVEEIPGLEVAAEVGNGPQVFAFLESQAVDCLLIDVAMPDFEPIAAIRSIRTRFPGLKILVISAYDDDIYVQGLLGEGVNGYHLKDQPLSDLKLAVQKVLAGERWVSGPLIDKLLSAQPGSGAAPPGSTGPLLTLRQRDLLHLLQQGLDNQSIAQQMSLSVKTVENHLTRLYRQLDVQSRLEAVNYLMRHPQILSISGQEAASAAEPTATEIDCISVLVVDDSSRYRVQLQRMIGKVCPLAAIYEAENLQTAVHLAQRLEPQLVLVDVVLGDEDGIQCARRIRHVSPHSRIVLISAYPDREFHRLGLQAGAAAFLDKKDLDLPTLRQVIEDVIP